jgi:hypothetical protein
MPPVVASVVNGLRAVWAARGQVGTTGALRLFLIGALASLTLSSGMHLLGDFSKHYDHELGEMPRANQTNTTCTYIEAAKLFMDENMTASCAHARYRLRVSPAWRAFYLLLPQLPTFTSTGDFVRTLGSGAWAGVVDLFENNKIFFFFCLVSAWGFAEPVWRALRNTLRDRFNRRREREIERRYRLLTTPAAAFAPLPAPPPPPPPAAAAAGEGSSSSSNSSDDVVK